MTCDDGWTLFENKCYKISPITAKADTLEMICGQIGGKFLITFTFIVAICFFSTPKSAFVIFIMSTFLYPYLCSTLLHVYYNKLDFFCIIGSSFSMSSNLSTIHQFERSVMQGLNWYIYDPPGGYTGNK